MKMTTCARTALFSLALAAGMARAQTNLLAPTPPMGWMSWNYFGEDLHEKDLREMGDAMVKSGMKDAGYTYIFIDDGWQGGRDNRNHIIPDPRKFPSGMKALADYLHARGLKLGIYSDAGQLSCAGYTASYGFERQDAKTFASWGVDYLKYDYCDAPQDQATAQQRYQAMAAALRAAGRDMVFGVCCQVRLEPWKWAAAAGGQLWRMGPDSRDKWSMIVHIVNANAELGAYAGPGRWNDMCMLTVGLYGQGGPAFIKSAGCTDVEYQTQMSLWAMLAAPLTASCDLRTMTEATQRILLNAEIIALDQDRLGRQARRVLKHEACSVFLKPLADGDQAVAVLNEGSAAQEFTLELPRIGLSGEYQFRDVWEHKTLGAAARWRGPVLSHETKVFRLKKSRPEAGADRRAVDAAKEKQ